MDTALQNFARYAQNIGLEQKIAVENEIAEALDPDVEVGCGLIAEPQKAQGRHARHQKRARDEQYALHPDRRENQRPGYRLGGRAEVKEQQHREAHDRKRCRRQHIEDDPCRETPQPDERAGRRRPLDPVLHLHGEPAHQAMGQSAEQQYCRDLAEHLVPVGPRLLLGLREQPLPHVRHIDHRERESA